MLILYGGICASIFSTNQFSDLIDIPLFSFLCSFFCFFLPAVPYLPFLSVRFFFLTWFLSPKYFSQSLADILSFIVFFSWRLSSIAFYVSGVIFSFLFLVFCIPIQVPHLFTLLIYSVFFFTALLCYPKLGTLSSAVGQRNFQS